MPIANIRASTILGEFEQADTELVDKAVILTDGKVGTVDKVWLDEMHGLRISIRSHVADGWHPGGEAQRYRIHDDEQGDLAAGTVSHALLFHCLSGPGQYRLRRCDNARRPQSLRNCLRRSRGGFFSLLPFSSPAQPPL